MSLRGMLCSDGARSARTFVVLAAPPAGPKPRDEREPVIFTPPPEVRPRTAALASSGPRRPDQMRYKEPRGGPREIDREWLIALLTARPEEP